VLCVCAIAYARAGGAGGAVPSSGDGRYTRYVRDIRYTARSGGAIERAGRGRRIRYIRYTARWGGAIERAGRGAEAVASVTSVTRSAGRGRCTAGGEAAFGPASTPLGRSPA